MPYQNHVYALGTYTTGIWLWGHQKQGYSPNAGVIEHWFGGETHKLESGSQYTMMDHIVGDIVLHRFTGTGCYSMMPKQSTAIVAETLPGVGVYLVRPAPYTQTALGGQDHSEYACEER